MEARRRTVLEAAWRPSQTRSMSRFFTSASLDAEPAACCVGAPHAARHLAVGYAGCCAAIRDMDHACDLARIAMPTLIISGDQDVSMPWPEHGRLLASSIPARRS